MGFEVARVAYRLLSPEDRRRFLLVPLVSLLASLLQTLSVASIPIFFALALKGDLPFESVTAPLRSWGMESFSLVALGVILAGSAASAFSHWLGIKFAVSQYSELATRLLRKYLTRDYEQHLGCKPSELENRVQTEAYQVALCGYQPLASVVAKSLEVVMLALALLAFNYKIALLTLTSFGILYGLAFYFCRALVFREGERRLRSNERRHRFVTEALSDLKTLKVFGRVPSTVEKFKQEAEINVRATTRINFVSTLPRYAIETYILAGVILATLVFNARNWPAGDFLPMLSLYAAASVKVLPALQTCYYSVLTMRGILPSLRVIAEELAEPDAPTRAQHGRPDEPETVLEFDRVTYGYPGSEEPALIEVSFKVKRFEKVGIVGRTGAGKTTAFDLALGLLRPTSGRVCLAGAEAEHQSDIGYVPQEILLSDESVSHNIALPGEGAEVVCRERLEWATEKARLLDFIQTLPEGFETEVGARGSRLSGGQRQRVGIARALYLKPAILFLDEATSALDNETERQFFESLLEDPELTIVTIAHRPSVLKRCDKIVVLEDGRVKAAGSYEELLSQSAAFAALAQS